MDVFPLYGTTLLKKEKKMTFSNYNKNYLIKELQESLNKKDKEKIFSIVAELHLSNNINEIIEFCITNLKKIILSNLGYIYFFDKNINKIKIITKSFDKKNKKESIINSIEIRNNLAEIFTKLSQYNDENKLDKKILDKKYTSQESIIKNSNTKNIDCIIDSNNLKLYNLTTRGIREIEHFLNDKKNKYSFNKIRYWVCWTIECEKKDKKYAPLLFKNFVFSENIKYKNDFTLYLWRKLIKKAYKYSKNNAFLIIKSLYNIYHYKYSITKKKKREILLSMAIYVYNNDININIHKEIDSLLLFTSLKINSFYKSIINEKDFSDNLYSEKVLSKQNTKKNIKEAKENDNRYKKAKINDKMEYLNELVYKNNKNEKDKVTDFFDK